MTRAPESDRAGAPPVPDATPLRYTLGVGFQTLGRLAQAFVGFATLIVLSRTLDLALVGIYGSYLALYALLDVGVDAGSGLALLRRASAEPPSLRPVLRAALRFRGWSALACAAAGTGYFALDPAAREAGALGWALPLTLLAHLPGTHGAVFHLRLQFGAPSAIRSLAAAAALGAVLLLAAGGVRDPMAYLLATLGGRAAANVGIWWAARGLLREYPAASGAAAVGGFRAESIQLGAGSVLREGYGRIDVLLLRALLGEEAAGLYAPARAVLNLALLLPSYLLTVALPALAARAAQDLDGFRRRSFRLAKRMLLFALPAALLSLPLVPWFLGTFFGEDYLPATDALRILAAAAVLAYPGSVLLTALVARGAAVPALRISAAALAVNVGANLALIPLLGPAGAALARTASEAVTLGCAAAKLR